MPEKTNIPGLEGGGEVRIQETNQAPATTMAEKMDLAAEARGEKVLKAEMIAAAGSFDDLLAAISETNVMHGKQFVIASDKKARSNDSGVASVKTMPYASSALLPKVKKLSGLLDTMRSESSENLTTSALELPLNIRHLFFSLPEENGLRQKAIELYERKRRAMLGLPEKEKNIEKQKENIEPAIEPKPGEETGEEKEVNFILGEGNPLPEKQSVKLFRRKQAEKKITEQEHIKDPEQERIIKEFEIEYLNSVLAYRKRLKTLYDSLKEENGRTDLFSRFKRVIGRKAKLSEEDMEDLTVLRGAPLLIRNDAIEKINELLLKNGVDRKIAQNVMYEFEHRRRAAIDSLSDRDAKVPKNEDGKAPELTLSSDEVRECELIIFENNLTASANNKRFKDYEEYRAQQKKDREEIEREKQKSLVEVEHQKKETAVSPEKTVAGLSVLEGLKAESKKLSAEGVKMLKRSGRSSLDSIKVVGAWYNRRSRNEKIAIACSIAALSLSAASVAAISGALGAKFVATAFAVRNVKQGVLAAGVIAATEAALLARAERRDKQGLQEDRWVKHKELTAVGAGLLYFIGGRVVSSFLSGEVQSLMKKYNVGDHLKEWFTAEHSAAPEASSMPIENEHAETSSPIVPHEPVQEKIPTTPVPTEQPAVVEPKTPPVEPAEKMTPQTEPTITPPVEKTPTIEPVHQAPVKEMASTLKEEPVPDTPHPKTPEPVAIDKILKKEILIEDKLGKKGDSIWGSLKHNGVSERAIANYEKHHPHSINTFAHDKDRLSFVYDKETDTLKEVKLEHVLRKAAGKAAKHAASSAVTESTAHHSPKGLAPKGLRIKSPISSVHTGLASSKELINNGDLKLPEGGAKGLIHMNPDDGPSLYENGGGELETNTDRFRFSKENLGLGKGRVATGVKHYFGNSNSRAWKELSGAKAADALKARTPQQLRDLLGRSRISLHDAKSGREFLTSLSAAKITPRRDEKVLEYMTRAVMKLPKASK